MMVVVILRGAVKNQLKGGAQEWKILISFDYQKPDWVITDFFSGTWVFCVI